ncbi:MAG TPA: DUF4390 domain-containing protein [Steroidobacteraceae bacterium]|nr:DUF4390 domain-containing protein [Steroidobacteraceae bacterium]
MHSRRAHILLTLLALAAASGVASVSRADALDGLLEVSSAYAVPDQGGVYQLFARITYPVNDDIRAALKDGLTLTFDLDVVVSRERRFWVDETVAEYTLKRELAYHAVSDRYVTRDVSPRTGSEQHSYATLEEALEALGTVEAWPFLLAPQLSPNRQYRVNLRAGVRRGRLPDTLRVLLFWTDDWHRESEWFSWSLPR